MKHHSFEALRIVLAGTDACRVFLGPIVSGRPNEMLAVAFVDKASNLLSLTTFPGGATNVALPVDDILREAMALHASGIILAHNHPSEETVPSESDIKMTRRLVQAAEAINLRILDHIIFNGEPHFSFRQQGYI